MIRRIRARQKKDATAFIDIPDGDFFEHEGKLFLKININDFNGTNAVSFLTTSSGSAGESEYRRFKHHVMVKRVEVDIEYYVL